MLSPWQSYRNTYHCSVLVPNDAHQVLFRGLKMPTKSFSTLFITLKRRRFHADDKMRMEEEMGMKNGRNKKEN